MRLFCKGNWKQFNQKSATFSRVLCALDETMVVSDGLVVARAESAQNGVLLLLVPYGTVEKSWRWLRLLFVIRSYLTVSKPGNDVNLAILCCCLAPQKMEISKFVLRS